LAGEEISLCGEPNPLIKRKAKIKVVGVFFFSLKKPIMKRTRHHEMYPEQTLTGRVIPNTCVNIAMNEDSELIMEHVDESPDHLVFLFPLAGDLLNAACVHRAQLQE
jgi:hypothetical protein